MGLGRGAGRGSGAAPCRVQARVRGERMLRARGFLGAKRRPEHHPGRRVGASLRRGHKSSCRGRGKKAAAAGGGGGRTRACART